MSQKSENDENEENEEMENQESMAFIGVLLIIYKSIYKLYIYKDISTVSTGDRYILLFMDMNGSLKSMDQQHDNSKQSQLFED